MRCYTRLSGFRLPCRDTARDAGFDASASVKRRTEKQHNGIGSADRVAASLKASMIEEVALGASAIEVGNRPTVSTPINRKRKKYEVGFASVTVQTPSKKDRDRSK